MGKEPSSRLRNWVESLAHKPAAACALFTCAFVESSLFPVPPDFLLIPLCILRPSRSLWYAVIAIVGSSLGGIAGYAIGAELFDSLGNGLLDWFGWHEMFQSVLRHYRQNAWLALILAGFLPIPFQLFTIVAGWNSTVPFMTFVPSMLAGRTMRFLLLGVLMMTVGEKVRPLLRRHSAMLSVVIGVTLVSWLVLSHLVF